MKLIVLFIAIISMVFTMWRVCETKEMGLDQVIIIAVDMFYIIAISARII